MSPHLLAVVLEILRGRPAEEGKAARVVVAPVDAVHPEDAAGGLQEGGLDVFHLTHPHLDLHVAEEEVPSRPQVPHLKITKVMPSATILMFSTSPTHTLTCTLLKKKSPLGCRSLT